MHTVPDGPVPTDSKLGIHSGTPTSDSLFQQSVVMRGEREVVVDMLFEPAEGLWPLPPLEPTVSPGAGFALLTLFACASLVRLNPLIC